MIKFKQQAEESTEECMGFKVGDRIMACPQIFDFSYGEPGVIESVGNNKNNNLYGVRIDKYPDRILLYRLEELFEECPKGRYHQWVAGICEKCFKEF